MKRVLLVALCLLFTPLAYAAVVPTHVSTETVSFNSTVATVMTFNTATTYIHITNESLSEDVYVDFICRDEGGKLGFATTNTVNLVKLSETSNNSGGVTENTIALHLSIKNLGFISDTGSGNVTYWVTGEQAL